MGQENKLTQGPPTTPLTLGSILAPHARPGPAEAVFGVCS